MRKSRRRPRELGDRDPQEAVDGRLRDDAARGRPRPPAATRGRRRGSQPWNGKSGALTAKAATKPRKIQSLAARARVDEVERALREAEDDDRGEHQQRAGHRVDDELDRRREPARRRPRRRRGRRAGSASPRRRRRRASRSWAAKTPTIAPVRKQHQPEVGARPLAPGPAARSRSRPPATTTVSPTSQSEKP